MAPEDKQVFLGRPLQAQPEKSVTNAESEAGAASHYVRELIERNIDNMGSTPVV